jgi:hypothetical protein
MRGGADEEDDRGNRLHYCGGFDSIGMWKGYGESAIYSEPNTRCRAGGRGSRLFSGS